MPEVVYKDKYLDMGMSSSQNPDGKFLSELSIWNTRKTHFITISGSWNLDIAFLKSFI